MLLTVLYGIGTRANATTTTYLTHYCVKKGTACQDCTSARVLGIHEGFWNYQLSIIIYQLLSIINPECLSYQSVTIPSSPSSPLYTYPRCTSRQIHRGLRYARSGGLSFQPVSRIQTLSRQNVPEQIHFAVKGHQSLNLLILHSVTILNPTPPPPLLQTQPWD